MGQRARVKWLRYGDRNFKSFHASTINRRSRNIILRLKTDGDVWLEKQGDIQSAFDRYFDKLFTATMDDLLGSDRIIHTMIS